MYRQSALAASPILPAATGVLMYIAVYVGSLLLIQGSSMAQSEYNENAQFYLSSSVARRAQGDYQGAMADLDRAIQISPNGLGGRYYINRGDLKQEMGDSRGAVHDYNRGIKLGSNFGVNYRRRGIAKASTGDLNGAIPDYNIAIGILSPPRQRTPELVIEVHILRGNAWRALGSNQAACSDYKYAV